MLSPFLISSGSNFYIRGGLQSTATRIAVIGI
jgi:hypothetical protein